MGGCGMSKKPRPLPGRWVDAWCRESDLGTGARVVLYALANYMDKRGVAWPSLTTLARDTAMQRRSIYRALDEAEAAGWVVRERGQGPKGSGGHPTLYRSAVPKVGGDAMSPPSEVGTEMHEVGTEAHVGRDRGAPRTSIERPCKTSTTELSDSRNRSGVTSVREQLFDAIESRDKWSLTYAGKAAGITGIIESEARWVLDGVRSAESDGMAVTAYLTTAELVADALHDMGRKPPHRWSRDRFRAFVESAIAVRYLDDADAEDDVRYVREVAWR